MKCPKCSKEMTVDWPMCMQCGLVKDSQAYVDAVNVLLANAEEDVDAEVGW